MLRFTLLRVGMALPTLLIVAFSDRVVSGWASTAGLVALVGGIQLFTIGVLGEYVGRIFLKSTDRPPFVVSETTDSTTPRTEADAPSLESPAAR